MEPERFFIWLMPEGHVYDTLRGLIDNLSRRYGGPLFEPHVTLLGSITLSETDVASKTEELAAKIEPYEITLRGTAHGVEYFKCVFANVVETGQVMSANRSAERVFGRPAGGRYIPHLSLIYGNLTEEVRKAVVAETEKVINHTFEVDAIHLFSAGDHVSEWHRIKKFPLAWQKRVY